MDSAELCRIHTGARVVPTPDGVWHRDSHYWRKVIERGTQDTDFNKGKVGSTFTTFSSSFLLAFLVFF